MLKLDLLSYQISSTSKICLGTTCAGTVTAVSAAGALGVVGGVWYLKKVRAKAPVTCGVQSNENRLFCRHSTFNQLNTFLLIY